MNMRAPRDIRRTAGHQPNPIFERDRVLIRSYRGPGARWYREITAHPDARVHVKGQALDVRAIPAADPDRVAACSDGLRYKYEGDPAIPRMLRDHLETTLELVAR